MAKDLILVSCSYKDCIKELGDAERGRLFTACIDYAETGTIPEFRGNERFVFPTIKAQIDKANEEHEKKCKRLSDNAKARWDANASSCMQLHETSLPSSPPIPPLSPNSPVPPKEKDPKGSKKKVPHTDEEFDQFWAAYPRKVGKKTAMKSFSKVNVPLETILTALEQHKKSDQWRKDNGQFIPHPATWLNNERWADELNLTDTTRPSRPRSYRVEWVDGEEVVCFDT
jgi:hypothetical protein